MKAINGLGTISLVEGGEENAWSLDIRLNSDIHYNDEVELSEDRAWCEILPYAEWVQPSSTDRGRVVSLDGKIDGLYSHSELIPCNSWPVSTELHQLLLKLAGLLCDRGVGLCRYVYMPGYDLVWFGFELEIRSLKHFEATLARHMRAWWNEIRTLSAVADTS